MAKKVNKNKFAIAKNALRRVSKWWWAIKEAEDRAKIGRGIWECASCKCHLKKAELQRDHINPVMSTNGEGKNDMNQYIETLFCEPENIQILCKPCHEIKTSTENILRTNARKAKAKAVRASKPKTPRKKKGE